MKNEELCFENDEFCRHKFSFHYWCQGVPEVFNLLEDPLQVRARIIWI